MIVVKSLTLPAFKLALMALLVVACALLGGTTLSALRSTTTAKGSEAIASSATNADATAGAPRRKLKASDARRDGMLCYGMI